jgi:ubiquinone/menaquinone biosynthesis C-methylase UbiE
MSSPSNTAQHAYWNGPLGQAYANSWQKRDRDHAGITRPLMEWSDARPGEHVLDIGCGGGTTTLQLAERVRETGRVLGLDISGPMIALARRRAEAARSTAQFIVADASEYLFEDRGFDLAFSQLGVMFFADPVAAFRNLRRALKPRGRIAFACWRSPAEHLWASIPESAAAPFLPPSLPADANAPGRYSLRESDRIRQVLTGAGFSAVEILKQDARTFLGATPEEAAESAIEGSLQRMLARADEVTQKKLRDAVAARLSKEMQPDGVYLTCAAWLVRASA